MASELKGSSSPRGLPLSSWVRLIGALAAVLYGVVGVAVGVAQQQPGLAASEIDCEYRVRLIRDRVVALTQRAPSFREGDPQDDVVSNLIRETSAACSADAASLQTLERIEGHLRTHVAQGAQDLEIRRELLAH